MFTRLASHAANFLTLLILLAGGAASAQSSGKSVVVTERTRAELLAHAPEGIEPGKTVWVGLQLAHQPEWHSYWKNSGDSGLPTRLEWKLPSGVMAGEIAWPAPRKFLLGTLVNYGYEHTVLLPVPLTITPEFNPSLLADALDIKLKASWLVCRELCIPEEGEFSLSISAKSTTASHGPAFEASFAAQPKPLAGQASATIEGAALRLRVSGLPADLKGKPLEFFPETAEVIETSAKWSQAWDGGTWTAQVPLSPHRSQSPQVMPIVLTQENDRWSIDARVQGTWPAVAAPATLSPALQEALRNNAAAAAAKSGAGLTLAAALLGALLGGLILNLMPCVFPVLAIKVVGFAQHAGDQRARRIDGAAYSAGVIASFAALGLLVVALRSAGQQLGWGFQLQIPGVVASLAVLFTLIGLNLAGVFEFRQFVPSRVASLQSNHPVLNSFLSGVLAVVVASPCTAPFMGAALGFAIGLPATQALLIFATLGLGMALPYFVASWIPAVARVLPKSGEWMVTFRKLMAYPMFAAVAWLLWVLGQQSGIDAVSALLVLLVAISMLAWGLGLSGRARLIVGMIAVAWTAGFAWLLAAQIGTGRPERVVAAKEDIWQAWEPGRVEQLLAGGRPVFVDFTAAWCVTCQYNKKTVLQDTQVLADFAARDVALLRADWTLRDPAITAALAALGRNGVPLYVLYTRNAAPRVLSEILSPTELRAALSTVPAAASAIDRAPLRRPAVAP
ncbi:MULTISPECIES: protein-disulfide reductase DsbD family protein [Comamonadaceae]|jgi:thiol:disulfide interchange protein|uniref:Protein-disulfide reductase n=1 Tax=Hylemonella gracilis str. Niagara R TaxID=1458275 RepID=A0A016XLT0_9BURK|nr:MULTISPECIES: thioredoxin family protein [Comamonadaceae]EYC52158.1 protein-disulfide reductase [Hylemonella gracilis str. Niagara R]MCO5337005.1 thioredoxin family protein [Delftia tsuruhatensis]